MKFLPAVVALLAATVALSEVAAQGPASRPAVPDDAVWKTTESGLRYTVLEPGAGEPSAQVGSRVSAHYTGWLQTTGAKFDSSHDRGSPFGFTVGSGVIEGWSQIVQLMPTGAKFRVEIPPELGYGAGGSGSAIPPNSTLIFDIELLEVSAAPPKFAAADPEKSVELEEGLVYEVVRPGKGAKCGETDAFTMHYTLYSTDGQMLQSSVTIGQPITTTAANAPLPLFRKVPLKMQVGELVRVETNAAQGLGQRQPPGAETIVWYLELIEVTPPLPVPEFSLPPEEELESSETGLKWKIVQEGEGESPNAVDRVSVHYAGRLTNGTLFDSSYERGSPATFGLNQVIPGWTEGVSMMKPGEKRLLVVPPKLGYGERGAGEKIPPNSTLVFWIELISVEGR